MSTVIAPISAEHIVSFRSALDQVAREKRYLAMIEAPPLEQVASFVRENIKTGIAQFVALSGGEVVGWTDIVPAWAHGVSHRGSVGMGVLPQFRGQGIGRRLLEACIAKSWANGLTRVELEVRADNMNAVHLYERLGFEREGIKRQGIRIEGQYHDTLAMALLRDEA
jgi:putative acetyltransferase